MSAPGAFDIVLGEAMPEAFTLEVDLAMGGTPAFLQIAVATERIAHKVKHLQSHKKDHNSNRHLMMLVHQRNRMLLYLRRKDRAKYHEVIAGLGLRPSQSFDHFHLPVSSSTPSAAIPHPQKPPHFGAYAHGSAAKASRFADELNQNSNGPSVSPVVKSSVVMLNENADEPCTPLAPALSDQ